MPDNNDKDAWRAETADVRPLQKQVLPPPVPEARPLPAHRDAAPPLGLPATADIPPQSLDFRTRRNISRGRLPIEARLDLHDMTLFEAQDATLRFLSVCASRGEKIILIITGQGREGEGALKRALPLWLEEAPLRGLVAAYGPAARHHGGGGAWYIRLRSGKKMHL